MTQEIIQQMLSQINNITQSLDGTIEQINKLDEKIGSIEKYFKEKIAEIRELMNLIIQAFKTNRENTAEELKNIRSDIQKEIELLWENKSIEAITEEQMKAVQKMKQINAVVEESLYMAQLLSIIQMIREITGRAMKTKQGKSA